MRKLRLISSLCVALTFAITMSSSRAQISNDIIKIGVMADMNGPLSIAGGRGSVEAARMAAEEFGGLIADKHIEIVSADHQNKPDIGAAIARQWFNVEHVDIITDLANSAVGFAVVEIAKRQAVRRCQDPLGALPGAGRAGFGIPDRVDLSPGAGNGRGGLRGRASDQRQVRAAKSLSALGHPPRRRAL